MKDQIDIRIYYEDTDCGGVVYYGKYLTYLERARTTYLESTGISLAQLMAQGILFTVVNVEIKYHSPAKYGDIITILSKIVKITPASITFEHKIIRKETDILISTSLVKLACVDRNMKILRLKDKLGALFETT
ncbi:MAG: YbgC/FadM family acyl-CoA thioesterase [Nitrospirae bacterium]|nr:YbgC/FadM family acyl-CoA thioesterase [Nitrospirota bacterium]MBF0540812.1 YbgC/FadM family acyl-CoA thioesterase [Nitrospirota bacterium]